MGEIMKRLIGLCLLALAGAVFYAAFFKLAPYLTSLIPMGAYHNVLTVAIYIAIGYIGGIGIPLSLVIYGFVLLLYTE
jgi:hypothetical protein